MSRKLSYLALKRFSRVLKNIENDHLTLKIPKSMFLFILQDKKLELIGVVFKWLKLLIVVSLVVELQAY